MDWPITAWRWTRTDQAGWREAEADSSTPFALVERTAAGLVLHALNPAARTRGLRLHQAHVDACAIAPDLISAPAEPERAARTIRRLALWMERYSPCVTLDPQPDGFEGLFVDLTGGQHLFGGETAMTNQMLVSLNKLGAPARIGVADTPGAAWALARYGGGAVSIASVDDLKEALADLPSAALRLGPRAVQLLNRFGLRRIGSLYGLPRAALARRFRDREAMNVLQRLDQALGRLPEPLTPLTAPATYRVQRVFFEPMTSAEVIALEAATLAEQLATVLESDGVGARRLRLTAFRVDGRTTTLEVRLATPSRRARHLLRLLHDRGFDKLDLGFGVDALALSAPVAEPLAMTQIVALGHEDQGLAAAEDDLIDRLCARLGEEAVLSPRLTGSWLPEIAETLAPYSAPSEPVETPPGDRPILLFDPPEPIEAMAELPDGAPARFTWRRVARRVVRASGPERLAPEWWKDKRRDALSAGLPKRTRDYYRVEDEAGGRYWLYREGLWARTEGDVAIELLARQKAGRSDGVPNAPPAPRWWMHGLLP